MEEKLESGEDLVQRQQMQMDITECEHTLQRISNLRKLILAKRQELSSRADAINALQHLFNQAEELVSKIGKCLDQQNRVRDSQGRTRSPELEELEGTQLEMENLLPTTAAHIQQCSNRLANMSDNLATAENEILQQRLTDMENDFRVYSNRVRENRKTLEDRLTEQNYLTNQLDLLEFWCDETQANTHGKATFLDPVGLEEFLKRIQNCLNDVEEKVETFRNLETLKDRFVALSNVDAEVKHEIRRNVTQLGKRISDVSILSVLN
jgi:chromosome segregation ATPase